jgi:hypothetical protein
MDHTRREIADGAVQIRDSVIEQVGKSAGEVRQAMLLQWVGFGPDAMTARCG